MTASFTFAQIERFKREAKQLHRTSSISHSEALDQIAVANGHGNWSLLMKQSGTAEHAAAKSMRSPFQFARTPEQMRLALRSAAKSPGWEAPDRRDLAKAQVQDLSQLFVTPQNAVAFAIDYMTCLLTVPRFKMYDEAPAYWEMRSWLPYSCHEIDDGRHILVNRGYKPVGQVSKDWAKYEEFAHLHAHMANELRKCFTAPGSSDGYLLNDGCAPWHSRADAMAYLERLHILQNLLQGRTRRC
ncbi:MAG TPA: hypothetical protein VLA61_11755 [Ideonella sp.]|uniref:hypothetical protein n=1 Tax=Ideonella sp. TaxID=1929293 RepID=UPI002BC883E2|nr:hypothetical protein [Ideonella sp.]HSI48939.1 hypothetical protein [Ideonella sp.]